MGGFRGSHRKSYHLTSVLWECSHSQVPRQERVPSSLPLKSFTSLSLSKMSGFNRREDGRGECQIVFVSWRMNWHVWLENVLFDFFMGYTICTQLSYCQKKLWTKYLAQPNLFELCYPDMLLWHQTKPLTKFDGLSVLPMGFVREKKEKEGVSERVWDGKQEERVSMFSSAEGNLIWGVLLLSVRFGQTTRE